MILLLFFMIFLVAAGIGGWWWMNSGEPSVFSDPINSIDFGGHDIACHSNINDYKTKCKELCTKDDNCAGYVTIDNGKKCCYKTVNALKSSGSKQGSDFNFYVKNSLFKDFTKSEKKGINGSDIKHLGHFKNNIPALRATCSVRDNCKGFSNLGYLKTKASPLTSINNMDFYAKN